MIDNKRKIKIFKIFSLKKKKKGRRRFKRESFSLKLKNNPILSPILHFIVYITPGRLKRNMSK